MPCFFCNSTDVSALGRFCSHCGRRGPDTELECLIADYFRQGYEYFVILEFLIRVHGIRICDRTLRSILASMNLRRRNCMNPSLNVAMRNAIQIELQGASQNSGYRALWTRLALSHGISVPRVHVMHTLREMDPVGSATRRRRRLHRRLYISPGPNAVWHIDGYDKLKPYGFYIHGCIDGFSRKMLWLRIVPSNNDPYVIAKLFTNCIREIGGVPARVRSDCGTENVIVAAAQSFFRRSGNDEYAGRRAHIYGPSYANQRIEAWWSVLRRNRVSDIISSFRELSESGRFNATDEFQLYLLRFCFGSLLKRELDEVVEWWNTHRIRANPYAAVTGRPNVMYSLPHLYNSIDKLQPCDENDLLWMENHIDAHDVARDLIPAEYNEYFLDLMSQLDIVLNSWEDAFNVYDLIMSFQ